MTAAFPPADERSATSTDLPAASSPGTGEAGRATPAAPGAHWADGPTRDGDAGAGTDASAGASRAADTRAGASADVDTDSGGAGSDGAGSRSLAGTPATDHPAPTSAVSSRLSTSGPTEVARTDWTAPMVKPRERRPRSGWRATAYTLTGGRWNPGLSAKERYVRDREARIATQLRGRHVTAFFCLKGGISKTSTTAATSIALADLRPDPVFALDANPDAGDLAERLVGSKLAGISRLARDVDKVTSLDELSRYTVTAGRLSVLPGEPNPTLGNSLSSQDFENIMRVVQRYYSFVQIDCGTGVTHPLMAGILQFADTVVIPAAWSITGAKRAAESIEWLEENGFEDLARTCIVVLTAKDIVSKSVDKDAVTQHLWKAGDLIVVPADPHVADGALLEWDQLRSQTWEAYLDIASAITARFGRHHR